VRIVTIRTKSTATANNYVTWAIVWLKKWRGKEFAYELSTCHGLIQQVFPCRLIYNKSDGATYSTVEDDGKPVRIEIPADHVETMSLLKAIERSLRHRSRRPFVSMDRSYYTSPRTPSAPHIVQVQGLKTNRPRSGDIIDWPESRTGSKRVLAEIGNTASSKIGSLYEEDLARQRHRVRTPNVQYLCEDSRSMSSGNDEFREQEGLDRKGYIRDGKQIDDEKRSGPIERHLDILPWDPDSDDEMPLNHGFQHLQNDIMIRDHHDGTTLVSSDDEGSIFSIASLASSATDLSKASGFSIVQIATATRELLAIFRDDEVLQSLYATAIHGKIGPRKFANNFRRLLKIYSENLKEEANDRLDYLAAQLVALKARHIAEAIVERYQTVLAPTLSDGEPAIPDKRNDSSSDEDEHFQPGVDESVFDELTNFRDFLVESAAFKEFRTSLQQFVSSPKSSLKKPIKHREQSNNETLGLSLQVGTANNDRVHTAIQRRHFADTFSNYSLQHLLSDQPEIAATEIIDVNAEATEHFVYHHFMQMLEEDESLLSLHKSAFAWTRRKGFIAEYSHILRSFYASIENEAFGNLEAKLISRIRMISNWPRLARRICDNLNTVSSKGPERHGHDSAKRHAPISTTLDTNTPPMISATSKQDSNQTDVVEILADDVARTPTEVSRLKLDLRLLILPQNLRDVVLSSPRCLLKISSVNSSSFLNKIKARVEDSTRLEWDWWPLSPRAPDIAPGQFRLEWMVNRSILHTAAISKLTTTVWRSSFLSTYLFGAG
jgi:hypothetical protein